MILQLNVHETLLLFFAKCPIRHVILSFAETVVGSLFTDAVDDVFKISRLNILLVTQSYCSIKTRYETLQEMRCPNAT